MDKINIQYHKTKIGELILGSYKNQICLLDFRYRRMRTTIDKRIKQGLDADVEEQNNEILIDLRCQIDEYLKGDRKDFDIPIITIGTDFQKLVWNSLLEVKYGELISYLDLAKRIGKSSAVRAVASANGANSIGLIIPCHRIIGNNGELVGYAGGLPIKKRLLKLEKENSNFKNNQNLDYMLFNSLWDD